MKWPPLKEKLQALEEHNKGLWRSTTRGSPLAWRCRPAACGKGWTVGDSVTDVDVAERAEKKPFDDEQRAAIQKRKTNDMLQLPMRNELKKNVPKKECTRKKG